jgi:PBP1b-binding outer membrane lipoprotein LpoB
MKSLFVITCVAFLLTGCAAQTKKSSPPAQAETQTKGTPHVYR